MRIALIGAGIVGVCTAYELAREGHELTVFEQRGSVAGQASFANAGLLAPELASPWPGPWMSEQHLQRLALRPPPWRLMARLDLAAWRWLLAWHRATRSSAWPAQGLAMHALARHSLERQRAWCAALKLEHEHRRGCLTLLRNDRDLVRARPGLKRLAELGARFELLDAAQCRKVEPGLVGETVPRAGIYLPDAEVGNGRQFAHELRLEAQRLGVTFRFQTAVRSLSPGRTPTLVARHVPADEPPASSFGVASPADGPPTQPQPLDDRVETFDAIVVCSGIEGDALLRAAGVRLPLRALHGYSVTAPLRHDEQHPDLGPRACVIDARHQVVISRIGQRVRVAGGVEVGGHPDRHDAVALEALYRVLHDWFPGAARVNQAQRWKGARPMLPDGLPAVGRSGAEGIWLNLGHGAHGWGLAAGSAQLIADLVAGRTPAVPAEPFSPLRLR